LSLDGSLRGVNGVLPSVIGALEKGFSHVFLPEDNLEEASVITGIRTIGVRSLTQIINFLNKKTPLPEQKEFEIDTLSSREYAFDFSHIIGQNQAKRALEIAAAGLHNIILSGPP